MFQPLRRAGLDPPTHPGQLDVDELIMLHSRIAAVILELAALDEVVTNGCATDKTITSLEQLGGRIEQTTVELRHALACHYYELLAAARPAAADERSPSARDEAP